MGNNVSYRLSYLCGEGETFVLRVGFDTVRGRSYLTNRIGADEIETCFKLRYGDFPENIWKQIETAEPQLLKRAKELKIGQIIEDGVLMEDTDYPFVTKENIDRLFEHCKHVYCTSGNYLLFFSVAETYKLNVDRGSFEDQILFITIPLHSWHLIQEEPFKHRMNIKFIGKSREIIGRLYEEMPNQENKKYFESKVEEFFPKIIEAFLNYKNRSRLENLFKGE